MWANASWRHSVRLKKGSEIIRSAKELARSADLDDQQLGFLARSGALYQLAGHRHQAHWDVTGIARPLPLEATSAATSTTAPDQLASDNSPQTISRQTGPPCMRHQ